MNFVLPVRISEVKNTINKLKQISHSIRLNIITELIFKKVMLFLLLNYSNNYTLKVFPRLSNIYFAQLLHAFEKLGTFYKILHEIEVLG